MRDDRAAEVAMNQLLAYFLTTFVFTWLFWLPDSLAKRGLLPNTIWTNLGFLGAVGPSFSAFLLTFREGGLQGLARFLRRSLSAAHLGKWLLVALVLFPCLVLVAFVAASWLEGIAVVSPAQGMLLYMPFIFLGVLTTSGPLEEEFGWRGYALPRLQQRYSPLVASLILGLAWGVWHWPQFLVPKEQTGMFYVTPVWSFLLTVLCANVIYTWLYNRSRGSLLPCLVLHTQMNLSLWALPVLSFRTGYLWVLGLFALAALVLVVAERSLFLSRAN